MRGSPRLATSFKRLEGKVALITGGASGIGESTARLYTQYGAKVVIADIKDDLGHSLCKELGSNADISYTHCDVSQEREVEEAVNLTKSKHGKLDIMYNNAGIAGKHDFPILNADTDDLKKVFATNVYGAFFGAKHAASLMISAKKGSIIFTSSVASILGGEASHAYTSSKHAVVGLMKNLCVELGQHGIRVNCISPFGIATPLYTATMGMDVQQAEKVLYESANLKGAVLKAEDVAEAAVFLGSDESRHVSGLNLVLDGGYTAKNPTLQMLLKGVRP